MNRERIKALRDHLIAIPDSKFDMQLLFSDRNEGDRTEGEDPTFVSVAINECGTAACIAGHAIVLFRPKTKIGRAYTSAAQDLLDLDEAQADELFTPEGFDMPNTYSRQDAIITLDHLLNTGEVRWAV